MLVTVLNTTKIRSTFRTYCCEVLLDAPSPQSTRISSQILRLIRCDIGVKPSGAEGVAHSLCAASLFDATGRSRPFSGLTGHQTEVISRPGGGVAAATARSGGAGSSQKRQPSDF
jgi:hypothetical protein